MTSEEMDRLRQEMRERGLAARSSHHPMFIAGVLMEIYCCSRLDTEREALAYGYALLVDIARALSGIRLDWYPHLRKTERNPAQGENNATPPQREGSSYSDTDVPFARIGDLLISPQTDIPFGEQFRMGLAEYTIYDQAVKAGYGAGIRRHLECLHELRNQPDHTPLLLDDEGLRLVLDAFIPQELNEHGASLWRASFILGWTSVSLGLVAEVQE